MFGFLILKWLIKFGILKFFSYIIVPISQFLKLSAFQSLQSFEGTTIGEVPQSEWLFANFVRDCGDWQLSCEGSITEWGWIPKEVGLGWISQLAEHETVSKQEGKAGNNVCLWFLPYFLEAWGSILSSQNELTGPTSDHAHYLRCFWLEDLIKVAE